MKKRLLSLFLCAVMIFGFVPGLAAAAKDTGLNIYCDGEQVSNIELPEKTPVTVKALLSESTAGSFQWQIRVSNGVWANIIGSSDNALTLRYAMVANLLNEDGQAVVRCRFTPVDGKAIYSNELTVQMVSDMALMTIEAAEENSFTFTVLDPGSVVIHDTAKEPEKTPAPTETPASEESAAPSEEPAPTEEPAAPTEEPAPAEESAAPADPAEESAAPAEESVAPAEESAAETETFSLVSFLGLDSFGLKAYADEGESTPDVKTTYSVVINYKFENNQQVADSYVATLAEGSPFSATVNFPTVQGYLPYVNDEQQNSYEINIASVSENVTINVVYKPTNVDYTVIHYQQNVDNDMYREVERETKQWLTNSQVPESAKSYEGFYSLIYERPNVAADGSTVIEVYYDRYYYLMTFDLDGGYGTEPIYARYGASIGAITEPTKPGYAFAGWDKTIPTTMPAANTSYKANWTVGDSTKVTVVIWGENADDEEYSYIKSSEIQAKPGTTLTKDDLTHILTCDKEEHQHTNSCMNCAHTHTAACYGAIKQEQPVDGKTDSATENINQFKALTGGTLKNGMVYRVKCDGAATTKGYDKYYLYYDNTWYLVSSSNISGSAVASSNKVNAHEHSWNWDNDKDQFWVYNAKLSCVHTHTDSCYICGKAVHKHNANCYTSPLDMDATLWKLVKSDEVTVAADGTSIINVYYDRVEFTLHFRDAYSSNDDYGTITKKWGANIREAFNQKCKSAGTSNWSEKSNAAGPWTSYLDIMPTEDRTYYAYTEGYGTSTAYYYVEGLDGKDKLFYENKSTGTGYTVTEEEFIEISGFTFDAKRSAKVGNSFNGAKFYYTRNSYNLKFYNHNGEIEGSSKTVKYEAPLSGYNFTPDYPAGLEPNAYVFDGWYTTAGCYEGSKADLNTMTMPASDMVLYAKWVPNTHTVKFSLDKTAYEKNELLSTHPTETVSHGSKLSNVAEPKNGGYTFVGWFYEENGVEKAFDFANMEIRKDLHVYGKWSSNTLKQYTVQFVLQNDHSVKVADDITGAGLAGTTKTFDAKGGTDLYADYQEGCFPTVKSQSLLLDINATDLVITFEYVKKEAVPYTVRYINTETGTNVFNGATVQDRVVNDNRKAVVTETFKVIPGYMPDAYQKRLVVTAEGGNILIFYYTRDTKHAYYKITHYTQNTDGKTWTEYASSQAVGDIGTTYKADDMDIPGFTYDPSVEGTLTSGVLTENGLELKLYYVRNSYPYQVRYLEKDTGNVLAHAKDGNGLYGQVISESAIEIDGYDKVDPTNVSISIRIETPDDDGKVEARLNMITFYYTEQTVDIEYVVVGPDGCGTLDNYQESRLKVRTGEVKGSAPTAAEGFKFVGWYKDEDCTQPVDADWVKDSKLTPDKTKNYGTAEKPVMGYEAATYYAKFEYDVADLTITKVGCDERLDENQSFIFTIDGPEGYSNQVVIKGNGSVTIKGLKIGEYTIHEESGWSWRYSCKDQTVTLQPGVTNNVTMTNSRGTDKWLDDNASVDNRFN